MPPQNVISSINNNMSNDIAITQTQIDNTEITNQQNVSKDLHYHTNHIDFMYQRNHTKNDNRIIFILHSKASLHINERVIKSYKYKH